MRYLKIVPTWLWTLIMKAVAVGIVLLMVFMLFSINAKTQEVAQQAIDIAKQNKEIAQENQEHIDCIAELFARYTRDKTPISIEDLHGCQSTQHPEGTTPFLPVPEPSVEGSPATKSGEPVVPDPPATSQSKQNTNTNPPQPNMVQQILDNIGKTFDELGRRLGN